MIQFYRKAINFTILIVVAIVLLLYDAYLILNGYPTFSETIWDINQRTLALAFGVGLVAGHCFTVPMDGFRNSKVPVVSVSESHEVEGRVKSLCDDRDC